MKFGTHVSVAGGLDKAFSRAAEVGAEVFQCFSRPPQGGPAPAITPELIKSFKEQSNIYKIEEYYIHTPYFINLASANEKIRHGSVGIIRQELERGSLLGFKYVMTHMGSATDVGEKEGTKMVADGLKKVLDGYKGTTGLLIEISAGAGKVIGDTFEEIATILEIVDKKFPNQLNVCFDTAHAFASGYDLRDAKSVKKTFDDFDRVIGLERLKMSHCNDSKVDINEHKDRHEHIGAGKIGLEGFRAIVNEPRLQNINFILETPKDEPENDPNNLKILRMLKAGKKSRK